MEVVFETVTQEQESQGEVQDWRALVSVGFSVDGERSLWGLEGGSASWQLGVESNNALHSLGSWVRAQVL